MGHFHSRCDGRADIAAPKDKTYPDAAPGAAMAGVRKGRVLRPHAAAPCR